MFAEHIVRTPGKPAALRLRIDESGRKLRADGADCVFVYAEVVDKAGTVCTQYEGDVQLAVEGGIRVVGPAKAPAENGTAAFLVQSTGALAPAKLFVSSKGLLSKKLAITYLK